MYFSREALYNYVVDPNIPCYQKDMIHEMIGDRRITKSSVARAHKLAMNAILEREPNGYCDETDTEWSVWKWFRPWDVVPELRSWSPPVGDYGIGIEVETGFVTLEDAQFIANTVKNWRHITLDFEGGDVPIEATFPPALYSKFGPKSQACRYLKLLTNNSHMVEEHDGTDDCADQWGVHVNVSKGGVPNFQVYGDRINEVNRIISSYSGFEGVTLTRQQQYKYFNRMPYAGIRRGGTDAKFLEFKMFDTTTDWRVLRRYVDISVELVDLVASNQRITYLSVVDALERGYNKNS